MELRRHIVAPPQESVVVEDRDPVDCGGDLIHERRRGSSALRPGSGLVSIHMSAEYPDRTLFNFNLSCRLRNRIQLTPDRPAGYSHAIEDRFGSDLDYATLTKIFGES
jgi:hypothetical protein